ncbi:MAG: hypothetical protein ACE366_20180 [Bradymonadia bacterium]
MLTVDRMPRDSELAMSGGTLGERIEETVSLWRRDLVIFGVVGACIAAPLMAAVAVESTFVRLLISLPVFAGAVLAVALFAPTVCRRRRGLGHGMRHTVSVALARMPALLLVGVITAAVAMAPTLAAWGAIRGFELGLLGSAALLGASALGAAYGGSRLLMAAPAMVAEDMNIKASIHRSLVMTRGEALTVMPVLMFAGGTVVLGALLPGWMGVSSLYLMPLCIAGISLGAVALACTYMWLRGD